jgi:hypothetical protein
MVEIIDTKRLELPDDQLSGITDLEIRGGANPVLYASSEVINGISAWNIAGTGTPVFMSTLDYASNRGTKGVAQMTIASIEGQDVLLPAGRFDDRLAIHKLGVDGDFSGMKYLGASPARIGSFTNTEVIQFSGKSFLVASQYGIEGFETFRIRDDLSLEYRRHFDDNARAHIKQISAMASGEVADRKFFFTASAIEDGVTAYWMGQWGNVRERGTLSPENSLWVDAPTALATVDVGGYLYLVIAAAGSGTLTTVRVSQWAALSVQDHEIDSLETRLAGVTAVATAQVGQHSYVVAGGADDGISLYEISADGQLHHLMSIPDQTGTTLQNITAITLQVVGQDLQVFVAGSEAGMTRFTIDLGNLGDQISGNRWADTLTGTDLDDVILGFDGNDILIGGDGNDRIIDGKGADTMTGGNGADIFVFRQDTRMDTVTDFEVGIDKLDLTGFAMLHSFGQLKMTQKGYGVLVEFGADRFRLEIETGQLLVSDLSADDFIFS